MFSFLLVYSNSSDILSTSFVNQTIFNNFMLLFRPMSSPDMDGEIGSFEQQPKNGMALAILEILDSKKQKNKMKVRSISKYIRRAGYGRSPLRLLNIFY